MGLFLPLDLNFAGSEGVRGHLARFFHPLSDVACHATCIHTYEYIQHLLKAKFYTKVKFSHRP